MKQSEPEVKLSEEEFDRLEEIALRRLAEFGVTPDECELLLGIESENGAGSVDFKWSLDEGAVAGATWTRKEIECWLRQMADPGMSEADRRDADYQSCRSQSGVK